MSGLIEHDWGVAIEVDGDAVLDDGWIEKAESFVEGAQSGQDMMMIRRWLTVDGADDVAQEAEQVVWSDEAVGIAVGRAAGRRSWHSRGGEDDKAIVHHLAQGPFEETADLV